MSHTVYEEGNLGNFPRPSALSAENAPMLPPPTRAACHQGLYLDTDGDGLIGRAENGMYLLHPSKKDLPDWNSFNQLIFIQAVLKVGHFIRLLATPCTSNY